MSAMIENTSPVVCDENYEPQIEVTSVETASKKAKQHEAKSEKAKVLQQATSHNIDSSRETSGKELDSSGAKGNPMLETSPGNTTGGTLDPTGGNSTTDTTFEQAEEQAKSVLEELQSNAKELRQAHALIVANCHELSKKMSDGVGVKEESRRQKALKHVEELLAKEGEEFVAKHDGTVDSLIKEFESIGVVSAQMKQLADNMKYKCDIDDVSDEKEEEEVPGRKSKPQ